MDASKYHTGFLKPFITDSRKLPEGNKRNLISFNDKIYSTNAEHIIIDIEKSDTALSFDIKLMMNNNGKFKKVKVGKIVIPYSILAYTHNIAENDVKHIYVCFDSIFDCVVSQEYDKQIVLDTDENLNFALDRFNDFGLRFLVIENVIESVLFHTFTLKLSGQPVHSRKMV